MSESESKETKESAASEEAPEGASKEASPSNEPGAPEAEAKDEGPAKDADGKDADESSTSEEPPASDEPADAKSSEPASDAGEAAEEAPMGFLRGGHALQLKRGLLTFGIGALVPILIMSRDVQWRWGVPVGFLFVLVAAFGALDIIGSFEDHLPWRRGLPKKGEFGVATLPPARVRKEIIDGAAALRPAAATFVALVATMYLMGTAVGWASGLAVMVGWVAVCALGFRTLAALGLVDDESRPLQEREGFWLIVFCCVLYLPTLGAHSLVDPWETHYGEVSREILARDDWITIWWAEEGFFTSKPILDFWVQALVMATFGVGFRPDKMIAPKEIGGELQHPEWIVRLPSLALSVVALYLAYRAIAQIRGRRAGLLSAMVLSTMAYWNMLSHQSITDMPFVASLTAAMCLLIIGLTTDDDRTVEGTTIKFGKRTITVSAFHLAVGVILVLALPQVFYLVSRNFTLLSEGGPLFGWGFDRHLDSFKTGSGLECWMSPTTGDSFERLMRMGKWPCDVQPYAHKELQPALQGLIWLAALGLLVAWNRNERRISRLCFLVAWVFASVSTMGKGVAGFVLPIAVAGVYVVTARKWKDILRLELFSGLLVLATVAAPWFIANYIRMGDEFFQQLFIHHMVKRALDHVHDTNTGDDVSIRYYIWQLGYGMFPWTGLVPAGLVWWMRQRWGQKAAVLTVEDERRRDVSTFLVMWFVFSWGLFTYMKTKFHHYVFPAVPPAALLTGLFLDDMLGKARGEDEARPSIVSRLPWILATTAGVALAAWGLSRLVPGTFFGWFDPKAMTSGPNASLDLSSPIAPAPGLGLALAFVGIGIALFAQRLAPPAAVGVDEGDAAERTSRATMLGAAAVGAAFVTALVTRDLGSRPESDIKGQERLIHLYTYRYDRLWPREVSFTPALVGFGLVATLFVVLLVRKSLRRQATFALVGVATLFSAWTLDVYMMKVAPHWGQRPLFEAYYRDRKSEKEPLVAFEMNWKGENFYSGGRLIEFGNGMGQGATAGERASDRMRTWLNDMKTKTKAIYFVTEAGRVGKIDDMLRGALGPPPNGKSWTERITTDEQTNKFVVVRARWN
ncbi:MAG: glycosyltransferase family 39 protein [Myxococcales bacterium]|nr:glycosyltransferase family 39 protein [Myxococcales bacterium]